IAQRIRHRDRIEVLDGEGANVEHTPELIGAIFDEELDKLIRELPSAAPRGSVDTLVEARRVSEAMIRSGEFDPI
ncbi:MAG TPA: hypothetical protein VGO73_10080, partial [Pyrinomonadaceae bacterium]|nr:hypothetical protein [Pyrinomonadaceae bacterium]